jgi:hypothetical protein
MALRAMIGDELGISSFLEQFLSVTIEQVGEVSRDTQRSASGP